VPPELDASATTFRTPLRVFVSYSHKDDDYLQELGTHLSLLVRQKIIEHWTDHRIEPGADWFEEINGQLAAADVILLLVSADFLDSDYVWKELDRALERHCAGEAKVIPIIIRHCEWGSTPFAKFQVLPTKNGPIATWKDRDAAYKEVASKIRELAAARAKVNLKSTRNSSTPVVVNINEKIAEPKLSNQLAQNGSIPGIANPLRSDAKDGSALRETGNKWSSGRKLVLSVLSVALLTSAIIIITYYHAKRRPGPTGYMPPEPVPSVAQTTPTATPTSPIVPLNAPESTSQRILSISASTPRTASIPSPAMSTAASTGAKLRSSKVQTSQMRPRATSVKNGTSRPRAVFVGQSKPETHAISIGNSSPSSVP